MRDRLLVIEGPDGMGKSTLITKLQARFPNLRYMHTGGPKTGEELERLYELFSGLSGGSLLDRLPQISEVVYRPMKGIPAFRPEQEAFILTQAVRLNPVIVMCLQEGDPEVLLKKLPVNEIRPHKSLEWWQKVRNHYPRIVSEYRRLTDILAPRTDLLTYDWTKDPSADRVFQWLEVFEFKEDN